MRFSRIFVLVTVFVSTLSAFAAENGKAADTAKARKPAAQGAFICDFVSSGDNVDLLEKIEAYLNKNCNPSKSFSISEDRVCCIQK